VQAGGHWDGSLRVRGRRRRREISTRKVNHHLLFVAFPS
jgi:hypothetical protein